MIWVYGSAISVAYTPSMFTPCRRLDAHHSCAGSLLKRLSNAILTKAKRKHSAAAQHSSPVERGATPNDDLREGSPPRVTGPTATEAKAVPTETSDTEKSHQDRNGAADLQ
ncbi:uncharacterized protein LOC142584364 [Dermacentor variabilis]|uniref:uncharacterized protein LOC142584364 n=1 Tax=Dermacentor variabilis TaxID=34621 RepID=UPI003F5AE041